MENIPLPNNDLGYLKPESNKKIGFYILAVLLSLALLYFFFLSAPINFPIGKTFEVDPGMSLKGVSLKLKSENIIRSRVIFEALVILSSKEKKIVSTNYFFENKLSVFEVVRRITKGEHGMAPVSVTIPEGFNSEQIGDTFSRVLPGFSKTGFLLKAKNLEGYLFPDTYFFLTTDNEKDVIASMSKNFEKKITPLLPEIAASGKSKKDIIIMASIIEREAEGDSDRNIISGILWKRIAIGMPLQVDAAPETYKIKGLTQSPIGNPGLDSIKAAIHPQKSSYLYYLHDSDGNIHYASSFAEHVKNKLKYLK